MSPLEHASTDRRMPVAPVGPVDILLVDDHPDKLVALESVLAELGQNIVKAHSGKEALRRLLERDFAVILLDVNMPIMDGFETAAVLRQRARNEHTPIIFITAYGDDTHVARGYSLGAVDYILTPVVPEVLRAKVSVFVELFRAAEQIRRQSARLAERAAQLHQLTRAALAINAALSVEGILEIVVYRVCEIVGAEGAVASVMLGSSRRCSARSGTLESGRGRRVVPLTARDGHAIGTIELADRRGSELSGEDVAVVVQLAQMGSIAIQNALFGEERQANQLKDEFLATVSHELRTPLSAMLSWAGMLRSGKLDASAAARGLEVIERNAKVQAQLIDDLLDMSRIITGKMRLDVALIDLRTVLTAAIESIAPSATAKGIDLRWNIAPGEIPVLGDPDRLQQVLWNLLSNAIKFTPKGGRVDVRLARDDGDARVTVTDTGAGISPEFLPHVFDRFRQAESSTTRAHGGLGLGLAIVRTLVDLHGGTVEAQSDGRGQGAAFTITLPSPTDHIEQRAVLPIAPHTRNGDVQAARMTPPDLVGVRVLVVEDEPDTREAITTALVLCGAEVRTADSAGGAIDVLQVWAPDVLVSDIGLPGEDGYALMGKVRARVDGAASVPAVALTAYAHAQDRMRALAAGYQAHLAKPIEPEELLAVVARVRPTVSRRNYAS